MSQIRKLDITKINTAEQFVQMYKNFTEDVFKYMVDPMCIEMTNTFQRKKNAWQLQKTTSRPIGSIDINKIYAYKTSDTIFKKKRMMPKGKSHGIVVMCDVSGSMEDSIISVLVNAIAICIFGKRNQIPVEVYTFTDKNYRDSPELTLRVDAFSSDIYQILSTKMTLPEMKDVFFNILFAIVGKKQLKGTYRIKKEDVYKIVGDDIEFFMGATPLVTAMMCGAERAYEMKKTYDKVSLVTITDGMGNMSFMYPDSNIFNCPFNSKQYYLDDEISYKDGKPQYNSNMRAGILEPCMANQILNDIGVTSIQINLTRVGLEYTHPIPILIDDEKIPYWSVDFDNSGIVKIDDLLGFDSNIFVNQKVLDEITGVKSISKIKMKEEPTSFTKAELSRYMAKKNNKTKILKIISSTVIEEICKSYI